MRLFSGEESPKSRRDFAPILTVPFLIWIFGFSRRARCLATAAVSCFLRPARWSALSSVDGVFPPPFLAASHRTSLADACRALVLIFCWFLSRYFFERLGSLLGLLGRRIGLLVASVSTVRDSAIRFLSSAFSRDSLSLSPFTWAEQPARAVCSSGFGSLGLALSPANRTCPGLLQLRPCPSSAL